MKPQVIVNKLLEVDDPDVQRYVSGLVPDDATLYDLDNALVSRGFQFWEYDPDKKVLVNRWVHKQGDRLWVLNPVFKLHPEKDYWNLQFWRGSVLVTSQSGKLKDMMRYFDRYAK